MAEEEHITCTAWIVRASERHPILEACVWKGQLSKEQITYQADEERGVWWAVATLVSPGAQAQEDVHRWLRDQSLVVAPTEELALAAAQAAVDRILQDFIAGVEKATHSDDLLPLKVSPLSKLVITQAHKCAVLRIADSHACLRRLWDSETARSLRINKWGRWAANCIADADDILRPLCDEPIPMALHTAVHVWRMILERDGFEADDPVVDPDSGKTRPVPGDLRSLRFEENVTGLLLL
jgi:hypothetical protein